MVRTSSFGPPYAKAALILPVPWPGTSTIESRGIDISRFGAGAGVQQHDRVGTAALGLADAVLELLLAGQPLRGCRCRPAGTSCPAGPRAGLRWGWRRPCRSSTTRSAVRRPGTPARPRRPATSHDRRLPASPARGARRRGRHGTPPAADARAGRAGGAERPPAREGRLHRRQHLGRLGVARGPSRPRADADRVDLGRVVGARAADALAAGCRTSQSNPGSSRPFGSCLGRSAMAQTLPCGTCRTRAPTSASSHAREAEITAGRAAAG